MEHTIQVTTTGKGQVIGAKCECGADLTILLPRYICQSDVDKAADLHMLAVQDEVGP